MASDRNGEYIPGIIVTIILLFLLCDIQADVHDLEEKIDRIEQEVTR